MAARLHLKFKQFGGCGALEGGEVEVLACDNAALAQTPLDGFVGQVGMVVLGAEVAEPDVRGMWGKVLHKVGSRLFVAEMSRRACDATLEVGGVGSALQHVGVVVGFDNQVVSSVDVGGGGFGDMARVGSEDERASQNLHAIADGIVGIVGHLEGGDGKVAEAEGDVLLNVVHGGDELLRSDVVTVDADVSLARGIDGQLATLAQGAEGLDMVGMIVGDEDSRDALEGYAHVAQVLTDGAHGDAGIDEDAVASQDITRVET